VEEAARRHRDVAWRGVASGVGRTTEAKTGGLDGDGDGCPRWIGNFSGRTRI